MNSDQNSEHYYYNISPCASFLLYMTILRNDINVCSALNIRRRSLKILKHQQGVAQWVILAALIIIALVAANIGSQFDETPEAGNPATDASQNLCPTKCAFFVQQTCGQGENNRIVGPCFPFWSCTFDHPAQCVKR
jgi:hypothetical protein